MAFHERPIPQSIAAHIVKGGLCGDRSHVRDCNIHDCAAPKKVVLNGVDASYAVVHAHQVPSGDPRREYALVYGPTAGSWRHLRQIQEKAKRKSEHPPRRLHHIDGGVPLPSPIAESAEPEATSDAAADEFADRMLSTSVLDLAAVPVAMPGSGNDSPDQSPKSASEVLSDDDDWEMVERIEEDTVAPAKKQRSWWLL
ncbi:hypothetical protein LTR53_009301 [Teratosphaeriaceae sp. CCFEE 6253]|nr:hypothetical protein LTR53_009301 [Teratosphaeriaceae sp. CCFEE 6253]